MPIDLCNDPKYTGFDLAAYLCVEADVCSRELEDVPHKREIHAATVDVVSGLLVTDKHGRTFRLRVQAEELTEPASPGGVIPPGKALLHVVLAAVGECAGCLWALRGAVSPKREQPPLGQRTLAMVHEALRNAASELRRARNLILHAREQQRTPKGETR